MQIERVVVSLCAGAAESASTADTVAAAWAQALIATCPHVAHVAAGELGPEGVVLVVFTEHHLTPLQLTEAAAYAGRRGVRGWVHASPDGDTW